MLKTLDWYIIRKFLGTFFFSIALIVSIAIVFDASEKLEDFISKEAPFKAIVFEYYLNFIPFFVSLFSPLFIFISVIFFTSKMAYNTEIVAILSGGVSFNRLLRPYMISAFVLAVLSLYLNNFIIPKANKKRLDFEETYIRNQFHFNEVNVHIQDSPGTFLFLESYNNIDNVGFKFTLEKIKDGKMNYKLGAETIRWDTITKTWALVNYYERHFDGIKESYNLGARKDTILNLNPKEFSTRISAIKAMDYSQLNHYIEIQTLKGSDDIAFYEVERYERMINPVATFILTLIGVSISSRKVRGGIGMHIGIGVVIAFSYLMFQQIFTTFAYYSGFPTWLAVALPNIMYFILSIFLLRIAPK